MNSLNFIDKEIKITKQSYSAFDLDYMLFGRESDKKESERLLKKLIHLEQIKAELEAWEVVKKHLEYFPSDYYNGIPEEVITMTSKIDKEDYPKLKKALEVEENDTCK